MPDNPYKLMQKRLKPDRYGFYSMAQVIPEGKSGDWGIRYRVMTEDEVEHEIKMAILHGRGWTCWGLEAGTYCTLYWGNGHRSEIMMSDTWLERSTNQELLARANGDVLIAGLGIGLILIPLYGKPAVRSITVIESNPDVVKLVAPHVQHPKLTLVEADIFSWQPLQKYDTIYFDIWASICGDNYPETKELHRKFKYALNRKNPRCWMESWLRDKVRRLHYE